MISYYNKNWKAIQKNYRSFLLEQEEKENKEKEDNKNEQDEKDIQVDLDKKTLEQIIGKGSEKKTLSDYADDLFNRVRTIVKKAEQELDKMSFAKSSLPNSELKNALRELADKITEISIKLKKFNPDEDIEDEDEIIDISKHENKKHEYEDEDEDEYKNKDKENNKEV